MLYTAAFHSLTKVTGIIQMLRQVKLCLNVALKSLNAFSDALAYKSKLMFLKHVTKEYNN